VNQPIGEALRPFPEGAIVGNQVAAGRGPDKSWVITGHPGTARRQVREALADLGTAPVHARRAQVRGGQPPLSGSPGSSPGGFR
jgi:pyridoxine 4-dehydrogenase